MWLLSFCPIDKSTQEWCVCTFVCISKCHATHTAQVLFVCTRRLSVIESIWTSRWNFFLVLLSPLQKWKSELLIENLDFESQANNSPSHPHVYPRTLREISELFMDYLGFGFESRFYRLSPEWKGNFPGLETGELGI